MVLASPGLGRPPSSVDLLHDYSLGSDPDLVPAQAREHSTRV